MVSRHAHLYPNHARKLDRGNRARLVRTGVQRYGFVGREGASARLVDQVEQAEPSLVPFQRAIFGGGAGDRAGRRERVNR
ncbi:hypothetical protein BCEP4_1680006 [Burkholderia cepacia]|nr:hypothetical protein BCEP4_1680006 [Burkholderia cepacia]